MGDVVEWFVVRAADGPEVAAAGGAGTALDALRLGATAGAWEAAEVAGWDDGRRRALAYFLLTRMEQLGREAAAALADAPPPATGPAPADVARRLARRADRHRLWLAQAVGLCEG
jgi:hypothetical protein